MAPPLRREPVLGHPSGGSRYVAPLGAPPDAGSHPVCRRELHLPQGSPNSVWLSHPF
jgi:hypothetical protein